MVLAKKNRVEVLPIERLPHIIEIFSGGCDICRKVVDIVTVGKCRDCVLRVLEVDSEDEDVKKKRRLYNITAVPTIVIDSKIKVVGIPSFPWFCGDEFYRFLEKNFPLHLDIGARREPGNPGSALSES
jgi:hypothetical protein